MENASKALIMAGEVLLSIIVASLLMIMVNSLFSYQQVNTENKREAQVIQFNNQFEGYNREKVRGNELFSLVNKVVDYNKRESSAGTGDNESGADIGYEPMTLIIKFNKDEDRKKLSRSNENQLFKTNLYKFASNKGRMDSDFKEVIDKLINSKLPEPNLPTDPQRKKVDFYFTEDKINSLLDNYEKIFNYLDKDESGFSSLQTKDKLGIFDNFNQAFGEDYFLLYKTEGGNLKLLNDSELWNLQNNYLKGPSRSTNLTNSTDYNSLTIWERLNIYYEYAQFKKGVFKCVSRDESGNEVSGIKYDENTGRVIQMEFEFTGKFD